MTRRVCVLMAAVWGTQVAYAATGCPDLSSEAKQRVVRLARFQHKPGEAVRFTAESAPLADCFYQVRLRSAPPTEGFGKAFTINAGPPVRRD